MTIESTQPNNVVPIKRGPGRPKGSGTKNKQSTELPGIEGPGVGRVIIASVDKLIARYVTARDERMAKTKKEVEAKQNLIAELRDNVKKIGALPDGTIVYRHDDLVCTLKHGKDELKVKTEEDDSGDE